MRSIMPVCWLTILIAGWSVEAHADRIDDAVEMLESSNPETIRDGIESLGLSRSPRAVAPLSDRIRRGLPGPLTVDAVEALGQLSFPEAGLVLRDMLRHRTAEVRWAAVQALLRCRAPRTDEALGNALADSDPRVRAAAALGLGELRATRYIDALFVGLDRGLLEAAAALGALVTGSDIERLAGYLGRLPLEALTPAFTELFARRDVNEEEKLGLIAALANLATPNVRTYLEELAQTLPVRPPSLRLAAQQAVAQIEN